MYADTHSEIYIYEDRYIDWERQRDIHIHAATCTYIPIGVHNERWRQTTRGNTVNRARYR